MVKSVIGHWIRFRKTGEAPPTFPLPPGLHGGQGLDGQALGQGSEFDDYALEMLEDDVEAAMESDRSEPLSDRPDGALLSPLKATKPLAPFLIDLMAVAVIPVGTKVSG